MLGLYRWLVLSLVAFILAHWGYLSLETDKLPDWAQAAAVVLEAALADVLIDLLLADIERKRPLLLQLGIDVQITRCKM